MAKSDKKTTEKVLRIGVIQDRQIVNERLIFPGEAVSVGTSSYNSFSMELPGLGAEHVLFEPQKNGDGYIVHLTSEMEGRVVLKRGQQFDLEELKAQGIAKQSSNGWSFAITESSRGKVSIGEYGFLFQFIPAPPISTRPKYNYKPRYFEEDDVVFFAFMGLFSMMAIVFLIFVTNAERPPELTQEEITKRFVHLFEPPTAEDELDSQEEGDLGVDDDSKSKDEEEEKEEEQEDDKKTEEEDSEPSEEAADDSNDEEEVKEKVSATENMSEADEAKARENVRQSVAFFNIGARSDGSAPSNLTATHSGGSDGMESMAREFSTGTSNKGLVGDTGFNFSKSKSPGGSGNADIKVKKGTLKTVKQTKTQAAIAPKAKMKTKKVMESTGVCRKDINRVVGRKQGQVQYCYERRLREDPTIEGRVVVALSIGIDGRVFDFSKEENSTGDSTLMKCIERKVKKWKFPKDCEDNPEFTFILKPDR